MISLNRDKFNKIKNSAIFTGSCGVIIKTIGLALLFLFFFHIFDQHYQQLLIQKAQADTRLQLAKTIKRIEIAINQRITYLLAMESYVKTESTYPDFEERFMNYAAELYRKMPGIRNFVVAPRGINRYVYPYKGNENVKGHNLLLDNRPEVRDDISQCLSAKTVIVSMPYHLRQGGAGIALRKAIYHQGNFWGLTTMVIDWEPIMKKINPSPGLKLAIRSNHSEAFYGESQLFHTNAVFITGEIPGGNWEFAALPAKGWKEKIILDLLIERMVALVLFLAFVGSSYLIIRSHTAIAEQTRRINQLIFLLGEDKHSFQKYVVYPTLMVIGLYIMVSCFWIALSDKFVMALTQSFGLMTMTRFQTYKGWLYVFGSASLIYLLFQHYMNVIYQSFKGRLQTNTFLYQSVITNFPNGAILLFDRDSNLVTVEGNGLNCIEKFGLQPDTQLIYEKFPVQYRMELKQMCQSALAGGTEAVEINCGDDIYKLNFLPARNFSEEIVAGLVIIQDISSLRQIEKNLKVSEERLRYALEGTNDALWDWDLTTGEIFFSPGYLRILGFDRQEKRMHFNEWIKGVHPNDQARVTALLDVAIRSGASCEVEFRVKNQTNQWCWLVNRGKVILNEQLPVRMIGTIRDISERRNAEEQIDALSKQIITSQEEERRRVSRELHDEAGQALTALRIYLEIIKKGLSNQSEKLQYQLSEAINLTVKTMEQIRSLAQGLRPAALETLGLNATLEEYCRDLSRKTGLIIQYTGQEITGIPYEIGIALYRLLQEGLTNIIKHACASESIVNFNYNRPYHRLELSVADNGKGFVKKTRGKGIGIIGIQERLKYLGGELEIESSPGKGTRLNAIIPWEAEDDTNLNR